MIREHSSITVLMDVFAMRSIIRRHIIMFRSVDALQSQAIIVVFRPDGGNTQQCQPRPISFISSNNIT